MKPYRNRLQGAVDEGVKIVPTMATEIIIDLKDRVVNKPDWGGHYP
jgi:hypothetical protein